MEFKEVASLAGALAWPMVVLFILLAFRKSLTQLLEGSVSQITKVSLAGFSLELAKVNEFEPKWSGTHLSDVRQPSPSSEFSSGAMDLMNQISTDSATDYAIIDLGSGRSWLTSRLYIFAFILHRMRSLRCFVLVETANGIRRRFVTIAEPSRVRWALARQYPWLEIAFAKAYAEVGDLKITSTHGSLEIWQAIQLVQNFLKYIQHGNEHPADATIHGSSKPDSNPGEWVSLKTQPIWERAHWLEASDIERFLGVTDPNGSVVTNIQGTSSKDNAGLVISKQGMYVALVDKDRRFEKLVDRQILIEMVSNNTIKNDM